MTTLNPNHPAARSLEDQWHKILAIVLVKYGEAMGPVVITAADVHLLEGLALAAFDDAEGLHVEMVSQAEAAALARKHGGLPV